MTDTTIYIDNLAIHEPVTVFTDLIITILCVIYSLKLIKKNTSLSTSNWKFFFLFFGLSTLVGSCAHAFFEVHEGIAYKSFWLSMQVFNVLAVYSAQRATFNSVLQNSRNKKKWNLSYIIQLIIFLIAVFSLQNFTVVVVDDAIGLIPIMVLHFMDTAKKQASGLIAYGILISFLTVIVHGAQLSINAWFNHNDIAHVLIMISLSIMFMGTKQKAIS